METTIRPAVAADCDAVRACVRAAYAKYVERIGREPAPMLADYQRLIAQGAVSVIEGGTGIGAVVVMMSDEDGLFLENIAVHPNLQGRGIGRQLMAFVERSAHKRGLDTVHLYTNEAMAENLAFYAHLGFREVGRRTQDGYRRVYFRKALAPIRIRPIADADRDWIAERTVEWWAAPVIASRGRLHRPAELDGFIAEIDGQRVGLATLHIVDGGCEVVTLNSEQQGEGAGSALLAAAEAYARDRGCRRLWLITTNDKARALRFYQDRGLQIVALRRGAVSTARMLKPEIPLTGENGVPIEDEIELAKDLT